MKTLRFAFVASLALLLGANILRAQTVTWTNTASGGWNTALNWSPNTIPNSNNAVIINQPGVTVTLNGTTTAGGIKLGTNSGATVTLSLAGQSLSLYGPLTVNATGSFTVDSGLFIGSTNALLSGMIGWTSGYLEGYLTLAASSTLNITGGTVNIPGCIFTNNGTVEWTSGTIQSGEGTVIYNNGLWNMQSDQTLDNAFGGTAAVFNNYGTVRKSGGAGQYVNATIFSGVVFNQLAGVIDAQNGTGTNGTQLAFQGGGSFTGGYITTNQYGLTTLEAANYTINGTVTGTNTWEADNGNLVGANVITGALTWVSGNWNSATSMTITPNSTLTVIGGLGAGMDIQSCLVTNNGTVIWTSGLIQCGGGTVFYNNGLWIIQSDQTMNNAYGGGSTVFNNYGTLRKTGGAGAYVNATIFAGGVVFNQIAGVIDSQNGIGTNGTQLAFQGGGNFTGGYITTNQYGLTTLEAANYTINGTVTGTNTWETDNGNLVGANVINGSLTWVSGNWNSGGTVSVTITSNSLLTIIGGAGAGMDMQNAIVTNKGTVQWVSGIIQAGGNPGSYIYNDGLWNAQSDQTLNDAYGGTVGVVFNNYGTFRKSGGGPEYSNATYFASGVLYNQTTGVLDVQNGTNGLQLDFQGGANLTGGYITTNQFGLTVLSEGNFNINGTVTGTNTWEDAGVLVGNNVINGALTWVAGNWNSGGTVSVTINSNSLLTIAGGLGADMNMQNAVVTNKGTVQWVSGIIQAGGNPGSYIYNDGLWNAQSDQTLNDAYGGSVGVVFNNFGTFRKSGGGPEFSNATYFGSGVLFNQTAGVLDVQNGTNGLQLDFQGGANLTGGYITTNQFGLTVLSEGNFNINGTVTGSNTWEDAGLLIGNNIINGGLTWVAGNWNTAGLTVTIKSNTLLTIAGGLGTDLGMQNTIVTNKGTVVWASGILQAGGNPGTYFYNSGLWTAQSDQILNDAYGGTVGVVFNNSGTFRKTGTAGGSTQFQSSVAFNNTGTLDSQVGSISLQGAHNLTNGTLNFGISGLTNYGTIALTGAAGLTGTVTANLNNGYLPSLGNAFTNLTYASLSGAFTGAVLPFPDAWTTNYTSTHFYLKVLETGPVPLLLENTRLSGGNFSFSIGTVDGQSYTVQQNTNLESTNWVLYTNITGTGTLYPIVTTVTNFTKDFFRVVEP